MDFSASFDTEEVINLYTVAYDGAWEKSTRRYNTFKGNGLGIGPQTTRGGLLLHKFMWEEGIRGLI